MPLQIALSDASHLRSRLQIWRHDYVALVREVFGAEPDPWQADVLRAFPTNPRLAMVACANPGKTAVLAWLGWGFLLTEEDAQAKACAISGANLRSNLWKEFAYWQGRAPLLQQLFHVGSERIENLDRPKTWFLEAATWDRDANAEQQGKVLAGLHARAVLFLLDEAGGIPDAVAMTAENALAAGEQGVAHVVLSGNPLELSGPLYRADVLERPMWTVFHVTGDPDDPKRAPRVSEQWAREQIERRGRDDYHVQVYVLGQWPTAASNALVSLSQFSEAFARWESATDLAVTPLTLGVDVARHGSDRSVVVRRAGDCVHEIRAGDVWVGQDTEYTAGRVIEIASEWVIPEYEKSGGAWPHERAKSMPIYVDDTGVGGGVTDKLLAAGYNAVGVIVGAGAKGFTPDGRPAEKVHANLKSFLCADIQERFKAGRIALDPIIRDRTHLVAEGSTLRVGYTSGRRKVEGKDEYKKRTGRSTDYWDAMMLAFADVAVPSGPFVEF